MSAEGSRLRHSCAPVHTYKCVVLGDNYTPVRSSAHFDNATLTHTAKYSH